MQKYDISEVAFIRENPYAKLPENKGKGLMPMVAVLRDGSAVHCKHIIFNGDGTLTVYKS